MKFCLFGFQLVSASVTRLHGTLLAGPFAPPNEAAVRCFCLLASRTLVTPVCRRPIPVLLGMGLHAASWIRGRSHICCTLLLRVALRCCARNSSSMYFNGGVYTSRSTAQQRAAYVWMAHKTCVSYSLLIWTWFSIGNSLYLHHTLRFQSQSCAYPCLELL